jgi:EAL domain-containing protein (putative c-di-GMP-specific phosphodiesterase class I)
VAAEAPHGTLALEVSLRGGGLSVEPRRAAVDALVGAGVRLSLDDVGRSAPLAALTAQPWDEMKIDASLVRNVGRIDEHTSVVGALAGLGHELGLGVVAEGVEHRDALDAVTLLGCDRAQGFYIQKPLAAEELTRWLEGGWPAVALAV